jgi:Fe-S cluster biogenesis protein NfuA
MQTDIKPDIRVDLEFTPNPNTLKYMTSVNLLETGAFQFRDAAQAQGKSQLASNLFALNGISAIMVGKNFVTVTLADQDQLTELNDSIIETIKNFLMTGKSAVDLEAMVAAKADEQHGTQGGAIADRIIKILDDEIRPAVAMDGGDITFEKFEEGIVYLHMKGSCAGCPSSTATLKMGIENRLRDAIPEVLEVVSI